MLNHWCFLLGARDSDHAISTSGNRFCHEGVPGVRLAMHEAAQSAAGRALHRFGCHCPEKHMSEKREVGFLPFQWATGARAALPAQRRQRPRVGGTALSIERRALSELRGARGDQHAMMEN